MIQRSLTITDQNYCEEIILSNSKNYSNEIEEINGDREKKT